MARIPMDLLRDQRPRKISHTPARWDSLVGTCAGRQSRVVSEAATESYNEIEMNFAENPWRKLVLAVPAQ